MNKFLLTASTAVAALALSSAAHATSDLTVVLPVVGVSDAFSTDQATALDIFTVVLGTSGLLTASFTGVPASQFTDISGGLYDGLTLVTPFDFFVVGTTKFGTLASTFVTASGAYTLRFTGAVLGAGYGGSATLAAPAVPEPATWGMMIVGLGIAGVAMRRRATKVSFA